MTDNLLNDKELKLLGLIKSMIEIYDKGGCDEKNRLYSVYQALKNAKQVLICDIGERLAEEAIKKYE